MQVTKDFVMKSIEAVCHEADRRYPKLKFVEAGKIQELKSFLDLLKQDYNLDGIADYLTIEINGARLRDPNNTYIEVPKHQRIATLKSFTEPSGMTEDRVMAMTPVIEGIVDFLIEFLNQQEKSAGL
jgi:hypothetical protein